MSHLDINAIGLQIILPLSLIAWLALAPMKSRLGFSSMRFHQHDHDVSVLARHEQFTHAFLLDLMPFGVRFAVRMQGLGCAAEKIVF
jgi:hypothetical protein